MSLSFTALACFAALACDVSVSGLVNSFTFSRMIYCVNALQFWQVAHFAVLQSAQVVVVVVAAAVVRKREQGGAARPVI